MVMTRGDKNRERDGARNHVMPKGRIQTPEKEIMNRYEREREMIFIVVQYLRQSEDWGFRRWTREMERRS